MQLYGTSIVHASVALFIIGYARAWCLLEGVFYQKKGYIQQGASGLLIYGKVQTEVLLCLSGRTLDSFLLGSVARRYVP